METIDKLVELQMFVAKDNSLKEFKDLLQFLTNSIDTLDKGGSLSQGDYRRLSKLNLELLKEFSSFYESVVELNGKTKSHTLKHDSYYLLKSTVNYFEFSEKRKKIIEKFNILKLLLENEKYIQLQDSHKRFIQAFGLYYENLKTPTDEQYSLEERILLSYLDRYVITNIDFNALFTDEIDNKIKTSSLWSIREDYKFFALFDNKIGELALIDSCYEFSGSLGLVMSKPTTLPRSGKTLYVELLVEGKNHYFAIRQLSTL